MEHKPFLNPNVVVDVVLMTVSGGDLQVLLIRRDADPYVHMDALPGGYLHTGETTRSAAERVLQTKAGIKDIYIEQLYTFDTPGRDPRGPVFSVTYLALVPPGLNITDDGTIQHPRWQSVSELKKLAFDHADIIEYAHSRLQGKIEYTPIALRILPERFTLSQLQGVYEAILGKTLDKRNFRKKIDQLGFVIPTDEKLSGMRQRPAQLYQKNPNLEI